jgi:hypothetical protein
MSKHPALLSANKAALILLRLGFILIGTLGCMFLLAQFGPSLPFGKALLFATALTGGALMLAGLIALFRELTTFGYGPQKSLNP